MMTTTIRPAIPMRAISSPEDEERALDLFCIAMCDDTDAFYEFVPDSITPKPVASAEDGSAAEIDLYPYDMATWTEGTTPIRQIVVRSIGSRREYLI